MAAAVVDGHPLSEDEMGETESPYITKLTDDSRSRASTSATETEDIEKTRSRLKTMFFDNPRLKPRQVPVQLWNSGDADQGGLDSKGSRLLVDTRIRKGPFWHLSQEAGAWCYQVYNKMYHPRAYITPEQGGLMEEYKYLTEHVTMWNVAVERQIQVKGPDATKFVNYVITRDASLCKPGKCKYVILCNSKGGILNDPVLLRPYEDEWWFSLADSDIGMYLEGINHDGKFDCEIKELDVAPVQIQGPKARDLMTVIFGESVKQMKYYDLIHANIEDCPCVISASGFSTEIGYEIYLHNATKNAEKMWNKILEVGKEFNLKVIAPGHHRRIEAGILSYGADMDAETNPYECGLGWQVDLKKSNFIGKAALEKIKYQGVTHKLAGLLMNGQAITWYMADFYHVYYKYEEKEGYELVGYVTSCWYSPKQKSNIGYAMLPKDLTEFGTKLKVALPDLYLSESKEEIPLYSNNDDKMMTESATVVKTPFAPAAKGNEGYAVKHNLTKL